MQFLRPLLPVLLRQTSLRVAGDERGADLAQGANGAGELADLVMAVTVRHVDDAVRGRHRVDGVHQVAQRPRQLRPQQDDRQQSAGERQRERDDGAAQADRSGQGFGPCGGKAGAPVELVAQPAGDAHDLADIVLCGIGRCFDQGRLCRNLAADRDDVALERHEGADAGVEGGIGLLQLVGERRHQTRPCRVDELDRRIDLVERLLDLAGGGILVETAEQGGLATRLERSEARLASWSPAKASRSIRWTESRPLTALVSPSAAAIPKIANSMVILAVSPNRRIASTAHQRVDLSQVRSKQTLNGAS